MIYEDDVVGAVCDHLGAHRWKVESVALAHQRGDDIVAVRGDRRLVVEAKGEGSSKEGTQRYGEPFNWGQTGSHVAVAVLRLLGVVSEAVALAALALPDNEHHRRRIERIWPALDALGMVIFWVDVRHHVEVQGSLEDRRPALSSVRNDAV